MVLEHVLELHHICLLKRLVDLDFRDELIV
jgi:hypothetical protein